MVITPLITGRGPALQLPRLVDTGLSCVAFALLIGDYMAKSDAWTGHVDGQVFVFSVFIDKKVGCFC